MWVEFVRQEYGPGISYQEGARVDLDPVEAQRVLALRSARPIARPEEPAPEAKAVEALPSPRRRIRK